MRLRSFTVRVHDAEHRLFGQGQISIQGIDADSLVSGLFPSGPSVKVVGGLYAEVYCVSEGRRWRFYVGQSEPEIGEIRARWGTRISVPREEALPNGESRNFID